MKIAVFIPVFNPGGEISLLTKSLTSQTVPLDSVLLIDSSPFPVADLARLSLPFQVKRLSGRFDHGNVRRLATELLAGAELIIFLTQDAIPADLEAIARLRSCFRDPQVGAAFGRQVPRPVARPLEAHARLFNYPAESRVKSAADIPALGIKAAFISNSFAAYRRTALEAIGGFPARCIVSEDTHVAARMLLAGWKVAYCAEAQVYHSHDYGYRQEFQRYFDIGVFHAREPWIRKEFGGAEGEGWRFLKSELKYLLRHAPHLIPSSLVRTAIKYLGFRAGLMEKQLPLALKRRLSMQKAFWNAEQMRSPARADKSGGM